jgi:hypothetical protein
MYVEDLGRMAGEKKTEKAIGLGKPSAHLTTAYRCP